MSKLIQNDLYLHISSKDIAKTLIPFNSATFFTVELPSTICMEGKWEVALIEYACVFKPGIRYGDTLTIYCDMVDLSPLKNKWEAVLRNIIFDRAVKKPDLLLDFRYVRILHNSIKSIQFKFRLDSTNSSVDLTKTAFVVLHLRKVDT
jgi:hypothetical protein